MNISHLLLQQTDQRPDALAIRHALGTLSYAQLSERVMQASAGLNEAGIKVGQIVAVQLDDPLDHWLACLALAHCGATLMSIPRSMPDAQRTRLLALTGCTKVLAGSEYAENSRIPTLPTVAWADIKEHPHAHSEAPAKVKEDQPWIYVSGSGSTGRPKIIPITHAQQIYRSQQAPRWVPYGAEDVLLPLISMHFYGAKMRCLEAVVQGAGVFLDAPGRIDHRAEVADGTVTVLFGTVFHFETLLHRLPENTSLYYKELKALMIAGSTVSMNLRKRIQTCLTSHLYVIWGSNESNSATMTYPQEVFDKNGTVGHPFPGWQIEVVNDSGTPVPAGETGHIRVRSPALIHGYLNDPDATAKAFREGAFYPGDIGHATPDGQLIHLGRADDMMIVSGVNLYPAEIEACLKNLPGVADALAIPLRHPQVQDWPVALVVPQGNSTLDIGHLVQQVRKQMGRHALHDIGLVDRIPRNEHGKVQREEVNRILKLIWNDQGQRITAPAQPSAPANSPSNTVQITFELPLEANPSALNDWLALLDPSLKSVDSTSSDHQSRRREHGWLVQVLTLTQGLLHVLRIPLFSPITVLDCRFAKGSNTSVEAACRLPDPLLAPSNLLVGVLEVALNLATWLYKTTPNSDNDRNQFFNSIETDVIKTFSSYIPRGKSTFEILRAAHTLGIPFRCLDTTLVQLGWGCKARRIDRSTTDKDSVIGMVWAKYKHSTAHLLRMAGLPAPEHIVVDSIKQAQDAAQRLGYPLVIKPVDQERGIGVAVDVHPDTVEIALNQALEQSPSKKVLVERQVPGVCHRLFIVAGKLLYAVKRLPNGIYADGRSSIRALIEAEQQAQQRIPPWKRSGVCLLDEMALANLTRQAWTPDSVPVAGTFIALRRIETTAWGGVDEEVTHTVHPDNLRAALEAAQLFELEVAGIDIISPDITQPWHSNGGIINEVNYAPLLGGGEISRRYIPKYLSYILRDQGRIPLYLYVGNESVVNQANAHWQRLRISGIAAYITAADQTVDGKGISCHMAFKTVGERVHALLLRRDIEALIVVTPSIQALGDETAALFSE